jgi:DNA (cytosine-5)-methyltransferase 1
VLANDIDPEMAWHYQKNLHPQHYVLAPINQLVSKWPANLTGEIDLLDGSPPCSTFSTTGLREKDWGKKRLFREGQAAQVLDDLFFEFITAAEVIRPRAIIAENVTGLIKGAAKGYVRLIFAQLRSIGYVPQLFVVDASRCGVPQKRERVFICARREDVAPGRSLLLSPNLPRVSARAATADLRLTQLEREDTVPARCIMEYWPITKPGESASKANQRRGKRGIYFSCCRLDGDRPSPTLVSSSADSVLHWDEPRLLSAREWMRLSSFPDDYYAKTFRLGRYLTGMSVPPKMAEVVAAAVRDQWLA